MNPALIAFRKELYGPDKDPASFSPAKMVGTSLPWAKIPTPRMKAVVKAHAKDSDLPLEEFPLDESVELTLCYFLFSLKKEGTFEKQMAFLQRKLGNANSWMITDALPQVIQKAGMEEYQPYYGKWVNDKREYARRFAYVYALRYYQEKDISFFLDHLVYDERYYVMMAQAWMLATFAITHFEDVVHFLKDPSCPESLFRETISKMRDSYRIREDEKEFVKQIRDNR